ncbi:hypothetical protein DAPPUDRAFT_251213 [Daphnia pulex]|uniref:Uncharacterized protein n=1 Tax=Daphnia pulex TaxID=6669 RepID=E9GZY2_DAPPU|nr:hypothetical protein DAPPUDRAFT_251213 [Daphnia pulex]|eukprot:EFX74899.1 hypothetical protein DAPPUDRAFT_251213 [Daphnia pulex]
MHHGICFTGETQEVVESTKEANADIVAVETEEEQRHRQEFLEKNRLTKCHTVHALAEVTSSALFVSLEES